MGVETAPTAPPSSRRWLWGALAAVVAIAGLVTAGFLLSGPDDPTRGERTATLAAKQFVAALNAGDRDAAAAASCANFADEARSVATAGSDPDIDFVLNSVQVQGPDEGTAQLTQRLRFSGTTQRVPHVVHLDRTDGKWLVCGQQDSSG